MRVPFEEKYDAIFNLFTSFGYFENEEDNLTTLIAIKESLSEYGFAVIDFLNVSQVLKHLFQEENKTVEGIDFHLKRYLKTDIFIKKLTLKTKGKIISLKRVKALTLQDFEGLMEEAGIYLLDILETIN
jgi:hypothetical protein